MNQTELKELLYKIIPNRFKFRIKLLKENNFDIAIHQVTNMEFHVDLVLNQETIEEQINYVKSKIIQALVFYKAHQYQLAEELEGFTQFFFNGIHVHHTPSTGERFIWFVAKRKDDEKYTSVKIYDDETHIEHNASIHTKKHKDETYRLFDVIYYQGEIGRLMKTSLTLKGTKHHFTSIAGYVPKEELSRIQRNPIPIFNIGDKVIIHDIPNQEKNTYPLGWTEHDNYVSHYDESHVITDMMFNTKLNIPSYKIDNAFWFLPYHLEKITTKD